MNRHYIAAAQTDIGLVKNVNQDSLTVKVANTDYGEVALVVLCDGMGGLSQGEVASAHVVLAFEEWFDTECAALIEQGMQPEKIRKSWNQIILQCNEQIVNYGRKLATNVGTTLTSMLFFQNHYYIVHVGDCRVYELDRDGECTQLTKDQTYVAREVMLGHMTKEQAKTDERRNVLLQCIGVNQVVDPDFLYGEISDGATYLICSDGFRHEITEQEIYTCCFTNVKTEPCDDCKAQIKVMNQQLAYLVELNKNRNERDNISAILVTTWSK